MTSDKLLLLSALAFGLLALAPWVRWQWALRRRGGGAASGVASEGSLGVRAPTPRAWPSMLALALAAGAFAGAWVLRPAPATRLAERAYELAMANHRRWEGEPLALLARARELDPHDPKALALSGTAAFDRRDYGLALQYWELLARTQPPGSVFAQRVQPSIAEARRLGGMSGAWPAGAAASSSASLSPSR